MCQAVDCWLQTSFAAVFSSSKPVPGYKKNCFKEGRSYTEDEQLFVDWMVLWVGHSSGVFNLPGAKEGSVTQHLHPPVPGGQDIFGCRRCPTFLKSCLFIASDTLTLWSKKLFCESRDIESDPCFEPSRNQVSPTPAGGLSAGAQKCPLSRMCEPCLHPLRSPTQKVFFAKLDCEWCQVDWKCLFPPPTPLHKICAGIASASSTFLPCLGMTVTLLAAKCPEQSLQGIVREAVGIEAD